MLLRDHRIAELVVLVVVLDDRTRQHGALGDAEALGEASGGDVADDHLDRDDLDLADELLAHVEAAHEMRRHADLVELGHEIFADAVVEHALAGDRALLLVVEGGGVVLEILHDGARLRPLEENLGLAFVNLPASGHGRLLEDTDATPAAPDEPKCARCIARRGGGDNVGPERCVPSVRLSSPATATGSVVARRSGRAGGCQAGRRRVGR